MIRIVCGTCQKPISVDEARIPPREVTFPCPACKAPVAVDGRALTPAQPAPAAAAREAAVPEAEEPEKGELETRAFLVGADSPALRQAARSLGFQPVWFPTAEACREIYLQEHPPLVFLSPAQLTRPPLADMQPLTSLSPPDRRRSFFILVGEGLKTFDGTLAFLYDVNLVVAVRDLPSIRRIWEDASEHHARLYRSFRAALRERL